MITPWIIRLCLVFCLSGMLSDATASPYAQWTNGPAADSTFFPIGVWLQNPNLADQYARAGINLYVGLWQGPTEAQLEGLSQAGMRVICSQNAVGLRHLEDPLIAGWLQRDEPDNIPTVSLTDLLAEYERMQRNDGTRPVLLNFGQGVANRRFNGRGVQYSYYHQAVLAGDIIAFDIYPVAGLHSKNLAYVADGVDSLMVWTDQAGPVWNFIETTRIHSKSFKATPQQVRAQVWLSLIHGSRGIVYFVHEWEPKFDPARLLRDPEMLEAVTAINAQLHDLAPVLNSPTLAAGVQVVSTPTDISIDFMAKQYDGYLYLFAVPHQASPVRGVFRLDGLEEVVQAEVVDEGREITVVDGQFADDFATYQVHLYRIPLVSTTAVLEEARVALPNTLSLAPNYPNPFNGATTIRFHLPNAATQVYLTIYNLAGQQVAELVAGALPTGAHAVSWDGRGTDGTPQASGVYFYRLQVEDQVETRRLLLLH